MKATRVHKVWKESLFMLFWLLICLILRWNQALCCQVTATAGSIDSRAVVRWRLNNTFRHQKPWSQARVIFQNLRKATQALQGPVLLLTLSEKLFYCLRGYIFHGNKIQKWISSMWYVLLKSRGATRPSRLKFKRLILNGEPKLCSIWR